MSFDLSARINEIIRIDPDAPALNAHDRWRAWSYLSRAVDELDTFLSTQSVGRDARIGIVMRNRPEVVRALIAMLATRRCVVTLSPMVPREVLLEEVDRLGLPAVLVGERDWGTGDLATVATAAGSHVIEVRDDTGAGGAVIGRGAAPTSAARGASTAPGVAVQMLTSGTTGPARRTDLTYHGLARELAITSPPGQLEQARLRTGTAVSWAPMVHIGGLRAVIAAVVAGRRLAMLEKFEIEPWRRLVTRHRPRVISLVPTALRMVYDADVPRGTLDSVQVVMCGTAPVTPDLVDAFERRYGVAVLTMYGATEFGGVAGWTLADWRQYRADKRGSVGRPNPGVSVRVVDADTGTVLEPGRDGLLEVTGGQAGTQWVRTTDRARLDHDGFLWILGRADDVIIRGGFKVSLTGLRDVLLAHPGVRDAVVIGVPDERLGQVPVAVVEVPDGLVSASDLVGHVARRLPRYQVPVDIRVLDALPRTPSMKPDGAAIRALFEPTAASTDSRSREVELSHGN